MPKGPLQTGRSGSAVVLLSSGLDSTFNFLQALDVYEVRLVLTFDYGQKAAAREVECSRALAKHYACPIEVVHLPWFQYFTHTALVAQGTVPSGQTVQIDDLHRSQETAKNVWVPNRNGIFLNIAAGFAEGLGADFVVPGFNAEEAQTFPDNSEAFLNTLDECWTFSTSRRVRARCFTLDMNKTQIVQKAQERQLPFHCFGRAT
jgi:7-cyano-7-deazaguanine synthase